MRGVMRLLLIFMAVGLAAVWLAGPRAPLVQAFPADDELDLKLVPRQSCGVNGCHGNPAAQTGIDVFGGIQTCRGNEATLAKTENDPHLRATQALLTTTSANILEAIGQDQFGKCLACHATDLENNAFRRFPERRKLESSTQKQLFVDEGVGCTACHNAKDASGKPIDVWIDDHCSRRPGRTEKWRNLPASEKAALGLKDLGNATERASQCVSCHVGNLAEGKFITHDMYAAGHPPLPSFEVATFTAALPPHWESLTEKQTRLAKWIDEKKLPVSLRDRIGPDSRPQFEQSRLAIVGSLVAYRTYLQSLMEATKEPGRPLDYAHFDCYACHHELKTKSWRQERGYDNRSPGRPAMREWPRPLAEVIFKARIPQQTTSPEAELILQYQTSEMAEGLRRAFTIKPFGDTAQIAVAARKLDPYLEYCGKQFEKPIAQLDNSDLNSMLVSMSQSAAQGYHDFGAARQIAWTIRVLASERLPHDAKTPQIDSAFTRLTPMLALSLQRSPGAQAQSSAWAERRAYDPDRFKAEMRRLNLILTGSRGDAQP